MPQFQHGDASIYYEVHGEGFPILTFAPMGLLSKVSVWDLPNAPIKPLYDLAQDFQIIVMDQRNAGGLSHAPVTAKTSWDDYADDHIALLDHLDIAQCHVFGQCIGGPFIFKLLERSPERFCSAVIAQTIGRAAGVALPPPNEIFNKWTATVDTLQSTPSEILDRFYANLYQSGFVYSVNSESLSQCQIPTAVFAGNDNAHPLSVSREVAALLPNNEVFLQEWKSGAELDVAKASMKAFLLRHTPA
ncbi:alpha/beta fold hydrolase [Alteromonas sp. NFXS44]|uniref:alpha/beta fold hydrolase n=1 Tax=Alteromonas sp. NFXS44 TaxID=2818435 RepID=UPI0032DF270D